MASVEIRGLRKEFRSRGAIVNAVEGVDITVGEGELLVMLGPSGCGKTTVLRCVAGLEQPTSGTITIGDHVVFDDTTGIYVQPQHRDIGMVFQSYALWPHLTVAENVRYPLRARKLRGDRRGRAMAALEQVQCAQLADRLPAELSGGQQQRVALARAIVADPSVLLLDEPLSNLDALLRQQLRSEIKHLHQRTGSTGIYVTHDHLEAFNLADRIAVMRAGRIEQVGPPQEIHDHPASPYVAEFLGIRNRMTLQRTGHRWVRGDAVVAGAGLAMAALDASMQRAELFLRPEAVMLSGSPEAPEPSDHRGVLGRGRVVDRLFSGEVIDYRLEWAGQQLFARVPRVHHEATGDRDDAEFPIDAEVWLSFRSRDALVYPCQDAGSTETSQVDRDVPVVPQGKVMR